MFGTKRLGKRSIIGTRVSALSPQNGRYYPGTIMSQVREASITSSAVYLVTFDDGSSCRLQASNIVGPGFQLSPTTVLKSGQTIFLTLNGREIPGLVLHHDRASDEVTIDISLSSAETVSLTRKLSDIRLLESRKSARLVEQADFNSRVADQQQNKDIDMSRKRMISHAIDVPAPSAYRNNRHGNQPDQILKMTCCKEAHGDDDDNVMMDEATAAWVLTSLCRSPKLLEAFSPSLSSYHSTEQSDVASSGFNSDQSDRDDPYPLTTHTPSPPLQNLCASAPTGISLNPQGVTSDDDNSSHSEPLPSSQDKLRTIFKCTWRRCRKKCFTRNKMERHIRRVHFNRDSDLELTDNEEDFHYTEEDAVITSINKITFSFAAMGTSSTSDNGVRRQRFRHRSEGSQLVNLTNTDLCSYNTATPGCRDCCPASVDSGCDVWDSETQKQISRHRWLSSASSCADISDSWDPSSISPVVRWIRDPSHSPVGDHIQKLLSWHVPDSPPSGQTSPSHGPTRLTAQQRLHLHQAQSPKSSIIISAAAAQSSSSSTRQRRPRSDVRKCRKVYGVEKRHLWCTQCRWKKACSRFLVE